MRWWWKSYDRFRNSSCRRWSPTNTTRSALSLPRGSGKSFLAAHIIERALTPGDPLFAEGKDIVLVSGSLDQSRIIFKYVRDALEPTGDFRWIDSVTRIGATHIATNRKLRVLSSNAKTSFGIVNTDLAICDEPGVWEIAAGQMMWDSLNGALGKPGSPLKLLLVGTLAPNATSSAHWWYSLSEVRVRGVEPSS